MKGYLHLLIFFTFTRVEGQLNISNFEFPNYFGIEQGLPSLNINDIKEDSSGFLWLGLFDGIVRYDGSRFNHFTFYEDHDGKSKIGIIYSIVIDTAQNTLWAGGKNGLFYSTLDNLKFKKYPIYNNDVGLKYPSIRALVMDDSRTMWIGGLNGLGSIDLNTLSFKNGTFHAVYPENRVNIMGINKMILDSDNPETLWVAGVGLYQVNTSTLNSQRYLYQNSLEDHGNSARALNQTSTKVIIGTYSAGVILFDKVAKHYGRSNEDLLNIRDDIFDIVKDELGYWFSTPKGVINLDHTLSKTMGYRLNNYKEGLVYGLTYIDSRKIAWFGYHRGLLSYNRHSNNSHFVPIEHFSTLDRIFKVTSIEIYGDSYFIVGYSSKGIYKLNRKSLELEVLPMQIIDLSSDGYYHTSATKRMNGDSLLLAVNDKLCIYNFKDETLSLSPLQLPFKDKSIMVIEKENEGTFWVGDRRNGLWRLDFNTLQIDDFTDALSVSKGRMPWVNELFIDSGNNLWVGRGSRNVISLNSLKKKSITPGANVPFYQDVYDFREDKSGRIWMAGGSDGLGFIEIDDYTEGVKHIAGGTYYGIFEQNDSIFWVWNNQLKAFNLNTFKIESVDINSDTGSHDITGPLLRDNDITLVGCNNGVLLVNQTVNKVELANLYVQEINANGESYYRGQSISRKTFELPRNTKNLNAQIGFFGFMNQNQPKYQYRTNDQWLDLDPQGNINLSNLGKGTYSLELRPVENSDQQQHTIFHFIIKPYWYSSNVAYAIYVILLAVVLFAIYKFNLTRTLALAESKNAKELMAYKSRMYTNITHEFRTPLTVILGLADTIKSDLKEDNRNHAQEATNIIERNGKALLQLVNQLLGINKIESGAVELNMLQADVIPFLRYIYESFEGLAKKSKIDLVYRSEVDSLLMDFDDDKLQTIISNLLSNALKFTPANEKVIFRINVIGYGEKRTLVMAIQDNGHGIPKKSLTQIFDRFYQVENVNSRLGNGSGIGLALSKELTELMGGTIDVKSEINKGTTMTVKLPITSNCSSLSRVLDYRSDITPYSKGIPNWSSNLFKDNINLPQVLIIEDNIDVVYYLNICLHEKYRSVITHNGTQGINMAFEQIPDIIICDVMMPQQDGFEVCTTLKNDQRTDHIPIILLTAKSSNEDKIKGLGCGADAYITKPFLKAELLTRLDQLILLRKRLVQSLTQSKYSQILNSETEKPETRFLQKTIRIIHEELDNPELGSRHLAQKLHMSESQVYRKIKAITGKSTAVFVRSVRLEKAKDFIQTSNRSISEIAYLVGFHDPSWFTRAFKKEFGRAPKTYQK